MLQSSTEKEYALGIKKNNNNKKKVQAQKY